MMDAKYILQRTAINLKFINVQEQTYQIAALIRKLNMCSNFYTIPVHVDIICLPIVVTFGQKCWHID